MASALTGVMTSVISKLTALLGEEYTKLTGTQREVNSMKEELSSMNALLQRLAEVDNDLDVQTKEWRRQVQEMSYDIEDCVDDFMHRTGHNGMADSAGLFSKMVQQLKSLKARHQIASQIQDLKARVEDAGKRHMRYKLDEHAFQSSATTAIDPHLPSLYAEPDGLIGIDQPRKELVRWLTEGDGESVQQLKVISIVGPGGFGKTTLANEVYRRLEEQFQCRAFVSLSQQPDVKKILRNIFYQVSQQEYSNMVIWDEKRFIEEIREYLQRKTSNMSFKNLYPDIYNICHYPHATVANVMSLTPLNISFRRALVGEKLNEWLRLVAQVSSFNLTQGRDTFVWYLTKNGQFIVRSMYLQLMNHNFPFRHKLIWKFKIPLKIKIFLWYLQKGVILTKDNLLRKNWKGSQKCSYCNCNETIKHLFFDCQHAMVIWRIVEIATGLTPPRSVTHMLGNWLQNFNSQEVVTILTGGAALCWAIWRCRNDIIFDNVKHSSFMQAIFRGTYWLRFWSILQREEKTKELFMKASTSLEMIALELFGSHEWKHNNRLCQA